MDREGLAMRVGSDWNFYAIPERRPAAAAPASDTEPGLWDRFACAFRCWWSKSCYDSGWEQDAGRWQCVCYPADGNWRVPLYWRR